MASWILRLAPGAEPYSAARSFALLAFVADRTQVSALVVSRQFGTSKNTVKAALDALGLDAYEGPRGVRMYTLGTAQ
jgi:hypothetical protein